ncbi:MAG: hypothetical protein Q4E02_00010 [Lagierella massiliensis]|nr:hypothetical protein [Lagierella massiliensis]
MDDINTNIYAYTFTESDEEYKEGYRYNLIYIDNDKLIIVETKEMVDPNNENAKSEG